MSVQLTPEFRLLVACSVWPLTDSHYESIRQLALKVEWAKVPALARRHRVSGLVWAALSQAQAEVSPEAAASLSASAAKLVRQNLVYAAEALRLQKLCTDAGLSILFVKGASLAQLAYGTLASRHAKDIDILVLPGQVARALATLEQGGYRRVFPPPELRADLVLRYLEHGKECAFIDEVRCTEVELHWRLADNPTVLHRLSSATEARVVPISGGAGLRTLGREDLFAYLCLHGAMHGWNRLKWLADIGSLLRVETEETLLQLYGAMKDRSVEHPAAQALLLCHKLFATPLPPTLLQSFQSSWRIRLLVWVAKRSMLGGGAIEIADRPFANTLIILSAFLLGDGWRYWLAEAQMHLTAFEDVIHWPLPRKLFWLYPFLRLPLWCGRRLRSLWRRPKHA